MERASFTVEAMIRGYHVYKDIWSAVLDEQLPCRRELGNLVDPFAVGVMKDGTIVGHVPRKISSVCSLFLQRDGSIVCRVAGHRRFSEDLPQGGLEIPCTLTFVGEAKRTAKAKQLIESAFAGNSQPQPPPSKKRKISEADKVSDCGPQSQAWVQCGGIVLSKADKDEIINGGLLNDNMINMAQHLLRAQFPKMTGLQSTLLLSTKHCATLKGQNSLQIVHSRGDHWIVASTVQAPSGVVKVYDSTYDTTDEETAKAIANVFGQVCSLEMVKIHKQSGGRDCGLFAIGVSTVLCFDMDPTTLKFDQFGMRPHFVDCLEKGALSLFPTK